MEQPQTPRPPAAMVPGSFTLLASALNYYSGLSVGGATVDPYLALPVGGLFSAVGIIGNLLDPQRLELETAQ